MMNVTRRRFCSLLTGAGIGLTLSAREPAIPNLPFRLGVITDELAQDFAKALDFISGHSLACCELHELWGKNLMNLPPDELERARRMIREHHVEVSDIASPLFKYDLPEMPAQSEKRDTFLATFTDRDTEDLLRRSIKLARFFGTNKVRVFSYGRVAEPDKAYPHVRARLARAARIAAQNKIILALENEYTCNIGTGRELGRILRDINSPSLRGNWDPANAVVLGEVPYPDGYREVRGLLAHMHVKDVKKDSATGQMIWLPVGSGAVDYRGQLRALIRDRYAHTVSLETRYRRPNGDALKSSQESLEGLLKILRAVA